MKTLITTLALAVSVVTMLAAPAKSSKQVGIGPYFKGPVGLQLYSLRNEFARDVEGTLARVRDYGFQYVELAGTYQRKESRFREMLSQYGLVPIAGHFSYEMFRDKPAEVVAQAKELGLKYAGVAWIPHQGDFTENDARAAAAVFNRAGELLRKEGIRFFYHTHGYEFQKYKDGTLFDLLMSETKPEFVTFEMDILWVYFPGQDPVALLKKYSGRWELMHLKDLKKGVATGSLSGHTDVTNDVALGTGQIPLPAILKAAKKAGVLYYFIEDESPSAATQIPQSLKFLESVKW